MYKSTIKKWMLGMYVSDYSLVPRPPINTPKGRLGGGGGGGGGGSGECSTTSLYLTEISVQSNWLIWQLSHVYWASLPQTTYLYSSYLYRPP